MKAIPTATEADMTDAGPTLMDRLRELGLDRATGLSISLGLHLVVLAALATVHIATQQSTVSEFLSALETVREEQEFDVAMIDQVGVGTDVPSMTGGAPAMQMAQKAPEAPVGQNIEQEISRGPDVSDGSDDVTPSGDETLQNVSTTGNGTENVQGGTEGAIDRLTLEIAQSLRTKKTPRRVDVRRVAVAARPPQHDCRPIRERVPATRFARSHQGQGTQNRRCCVGREVSVHDRQAGRRYPPAVG